MLLHYRVPLRIQFAGVHLYTWVERGTVRVKCPTQEHKSMCPSSAQIARSGVGCTYHKATAMTWNFFTRATEKVNTQQFIIYLRAFLFLDILRWTLHHLHCYLMCPAVEGITLYPYSCSSKSTSFHVSFLSRVKTNSINWSAPNVGVFITQVVEHWSANPSSMKC